MTAHFQFFNANIKDKLKSDTLNRIGPYWIYLVYPKIIVETNHPNPHRAVTNVQVEGLQIKADSYPLFQFLNEHQQFCKPVIESSPYLNFLFTAWNEGIISAEFIYNDWQEMYKINRQL